MKRHTHILSLVVLSFIVLTYSAIAQDAGETRLHLSAERVNVVVGQEVTVDIMTEHTPLIYGADVRLTFDPNVLEVVDADESLAGVQVKPGDFLDSAQLFVLQHGADNEAGVIDYALALLNPAPASQGNGVLAQVTFLGKAEGQATISISEGLFGTRSGERITPVLTSTAIHLDVVGHTSPGLFVGEIIAPRYPILVATDISVSVDVTNTDIVGIDTAIWDWGDGTTSAGILEEVSGSDTITGHHRYTETGVYTVRLTITDDHGGSHESMFQSIVIYESEGGMTPEPVPTPVPEPNTLLLFGSGVLALLVLVRKGVKKRG